MAILRAAVFSLLAAFGVALFSSPARADMSFRTVTLGGDACRNCPIVVAAEGEIVESTPDAFLDFVRQNVSGKALHGVVLLDSPGGKVVASMEFGQAIRRLGMAVIVARPSGSAIDLVSGRCYSACVYALMGGKKRVVPPQSRVGIHRMFNFTTSFDFSEGLVQERNLDDGGMLQLLSAYSKSMGVSADLVALAERTSPDRLYMLSGAEISRWRLGSSRL